MARATWPRPPVEPGVTGKEKMFQQGNQFGPGPTKPYPFSKRPAPRSTRNDGVYRTSFPRRQRPQAA